MRRNAHTLSSEQQRSEIWNPGPLLEAVFRLKYVAALVSITRSAHSIDFLWRGLVDLIGFEPMTSSMPWKRAPNCATGPAFHLVTSREYHTTRTRTLNFRLPKKMLRIGTLTIDSVSNQRHNQTVGLRLLISRRRTNRKNSKVAKTKWLHRLIW